LHVHFDTLVPDFALEEYPSGK